MKKNVAGPSQRQLRVAEEIRHVLAGIFARHEFRDPDLATAEVTVTEVRTTPDLKHATVFVARLGRNDVEELLPAMRWLDPVDELVEQLTAGLPALGEGVAAALPRMMTTGDPRASERSAALAFGAAFGPWERVALSAR